MNIGEILTNLWHSSGYYLFGEAQGWKSIIMIIVAFFFLFLGIKKKFEPLLLVGIAFGMLLTNLPAGVSDALFHPDYWTGEAAVANGVDYVYVLQHGGLLDILYIGVKTGVYPCLIFMGVGAMTDFGPMLSRPSSLILGAAAQMGIYLVFILAACMGMPGGQAASVSIIAGADGPTAIFLTKTLAPEILAPIAVAAYSYMALIPLLQPPFMKLLTTKKERMAVMQATRKVSKKEKIIFPILVTTIVCLLLPSVAPLLGSLMFGNLLKECGVTERLSDTAQNALMNIVTLFLGISVGATAVAANFLTLDTLKIVVLGLAGFILATVSGLLIGKLLYVVSKGKINPLIGSAGVSAVPMAARVSNTVGLKYNQGNYLLMHAMGPNVAGVIGSAVAAGFLLAVFG
ncbi:MAG: sodium ion-translocating decarboxylase subunit beta [Clostridia bacterium]|nr:sodium ion-translocating decarboxylase subunit beta [Clostridia bacterium]